MAYSPICDCNLLAQRDDFIEENVERVCATVHNVHLQRSYSALYGVRIRIVAYLWSNAGQSLYFGKNADGPNAIRINASGQLQSFAVNQIL